MTAPPGLEVTCRRDLPAPERDTALTVVSARQRTSGHAMRAIGNLAPNSRVNVVPRGILGSGGETVLLASPAYRPLFDLHTGQCREDQGERVELRLSTCACCPASSRWWQRWTERRWIDE
jgi:nitrite reductase/ring-hydroxylating ferredoxin subunit